MEVLRLLVTAVAVVVLADTLVMAETTLHLMEPMDQAVAVAAVLVADILVQAVAVSAFMVKVQTDWVESGIT